MTTLHPPPYSITTEPLPSQDGPSSQHPEEPTALPLEVNTVDLSGLRDQILDNAPLLFILSHSAYRPLPPHFRVCTWREPRDAERRDSRSDESGETHAAIYVPITTKHSTDLGLFVQGPGAESREAALRALLTKVEGMIGARRHKYGIDLRWFVGS